MGEGGMSACSLVYLRSTKNAFYLKIDYCIKKHLLLFHAKLVCKPKKLFLKFKIMRTLVLKQKSYLWLVSQQVLMTVLVYNSMSNEEESKEFTLLLAWCENIIEDNPRHIGSYQQ
jgi:hypothetical protein